MVEQAALDPAHVGEASGSLVAAGELVAVHVETFRAWADP